MPIDREYYAYSKTLLCFLVFISLGTINYIILPTKDIFEKRVNHTVTMDIFLIVRSLGDVVGCFFNSIGLDSIPRADPFFAIEGLLLFSVVFSLGFVSNFWEISGLFFLLGLVGRSFYAGINVMILNLWGRHGNSIFQALHFSHTIGAVIASIIIKKFHDQEYHAGNQTIDTVFPFASASVGLLGTTFLFIAFMFITWRISTEIKTHSVLSDIALFTSIARPKPSVTLVILTAGIFAIFFQQGMQVSYARAVPKFPLSSAYDVMERDEPVLMAIYWAPFMISQLLAIVAVQYCDITIIIFHDIFVLFISSLILSLEGYYMESILWTNTILVGWGMGTLFPTLLLWISYYIEMTHSVGAILFMSGSIAEAVIPYFLFSYQRQKSILLYMFMTGAAVMEYIFCYTLLFLFSAIDNRFSRRFKHDPLT